MGNSVISMDILTDEEFYTMKDKEQKEQFLNRLLSASEISNRKMGFSVKSLNKHADSEEVTEVKDKKKPSAKKDSIFRRTAYESGEFDDEKWNDLLDRLDEMESSPIDDVTDDEIRGFGRKALETLGPTADDADEPTRYDNMYKKELAMYAEILRDTNAQTRTVSAKLKSMTSKSTSGVSKYYSDLLEQYNSLNKTKVDVVKAMAELKTKVEDFRLKKLKSDGPIERGVDELVDQYYNRIMNGGRAEFMSRSLLSQSPYDSDKTMYQDIVSGDYESSDGAKIPRATFNITQPIPDSYSQDYEPEMNSDKYGYIRNEHRKPEICVQRWDDGRLKFIALDEDGLEVEDYTLPGEDLLESMSINPMSSFAYDKYGRKYTIIDIDTSGVDLGDLDDDDYQYDDDPRS